MPELFTEFVREVDEQRVDRLKAAEVLPSQIPTMENSSFSLTYEEDGVRVTLSGLGTRGALSAYVPAQHIAEAREAAAKETAELAMVSAEQTELSSTARWWALDLLGCHLANVHGEAPYLWTARRVGNGIPNQKAVYKEPQVKGQQFELTEFDRIAQVLVQDHGWLLIDGRTGSGKSTQTALWAYRCALKGAGRIDLDLIDANDGAESVMAALLTLPKRAWYLVVMEHIPASLAKALAVCRLIERLRNDYGLDIALLANGWLDLRNRGTSLTQLGFPRRDALVVRTQPEKVFDAMVGEHGLQDAKVIAALRESSGGGEDLVLAKLAFAYYVQHDRSAPSRDEFTLHVAQEYGLADMDDPAEQHALYRFACLGAHEIEVPAAEISYGEMAPYVESFRQRELIEQADTTYRVGSRSVAREMVRYAVENWRGPDGRPLESPAVMAATTLVHAGPEQLRATLSRLDFINGWHGVTGNMLGNAWSKWEQLRKLMVRAVQRDKEWGGNAAAAAFACMAMRYLDLEEHWELSAEWIRGRWNYGSPGQLPGWIGEKTTEMADFKNVTASMSREDAGPDGHRWPAELRGDRIDVDRMHRTWMLGVLLSFEGSAPRLDMDLIECLYESARAVQNPNGSFYPERVPWVTARVLIGLCLAGYRDEKVARDAALWLMKTSYNMGWKSGTGSWNTDAMTYAMCVIALLKKGVHADSHQIDVGLRELDVAHQLSEIDRSLKVEAKLLGRPEDRPAAYEELKSLLEWAVNEQEWQGRAEQPLFNQEERPESEGESTKLPFIVSQLLACIWQMVINELDKFFAEGFEHRTAADSATAAANLAQWRTQFAASGPDTEALLRVAAQLDEIGAQIKSDIESRVKALRSRIQPQHRKFFQERVAELRELQKLYDECAGQFEQRQVDEDLIQRINQLGLQAIGLSYEPIVWS